MTLQSRAVDKSCKPPLRRSARLQNNDSSHESLPYAAAVESIQDPVAATSETSSSPPSCSSEDTSSSEATNGASTKKRAAPLADVTNAKRQRKQRAAADAKVRSIDATSSSSPRFMVKTTEDATVTPTPTIKALLPLRDDDSVKSTDTTDSTRSKSSNKPKSNSSIRVTNLEPEERPPVPEGVVDLYPKDGSKHSVCNCGGHGNTHHADTTHSYLSSYGWEFSKHTKSREAPPSLAVKSNQNNMGQDLTPDMRAILTDWLIELAEEYKLQPRTLQLAVTLVDKSLAKTAANKDKCGLVVERETLQCLGCSCMWIACKIEEIEPPSVDDFVYISDSSYSRQQITDMELDVCAALEFHLWHVTPIDYLHEYLRASGSVNPLLETLVQYLLELSLLSYKLVNTPPSLIAASAVYLARATLGMDDFWTKTLEYYSGYSQQDLQETVLAIHKCHQQAEESQLKSAHAKYQTPKYMRVSLKTVLHANDLGF